MKAKNPEGFNDLGIQPDVPSNTPSDVTSDIPISTSVPDASADQMIRPVVLSAARNAGHATRKFGQLAGDGATKLLVKFETAQEQQRQILANKERIKNDPELRTKMARLKLAETSYRAGRVIVQAGLGYVTYMIGEKLVEEGGFVARWVGRSMKVTGIGILITAPLFNDDW